MKFDFQSENVRYVLNKCIKFIIVTLAVFSGVMLSGTHKGEKVVDMLTKINDFQTNPLQFLRECSIICTKKPTTMKVQVDRDDMTSTTFTPFSYDEGPEISENVDYEYEDNPELTK